MPGPRGIKSSTQFTTDRKLIEALSDSEKIRMLCYFMSHTGDYNIDYEAAAGRFRNNTATSFSQLAGKIVRKLKVKGGADSPSLSHTPGKTGGGTGRKRAADDGDAGSDEETPKAKRSKHTKKVSQDSPEKGSGVATKAVENATVTDDSESDGGLHGIGDYSPKDLMI